MPNEPPLHLPVLYIMLCYAVDVDEVTVLLVALFRRLQGDKGLYPSFFPSSLVWVWYGGMPEFKKRCMFRQKGSESLRYCDMHVKIFSYVWL